MPNTRSNLASNAFPSTIADVPEETPVSPTVPYNEEEQGENATLSVQSRIAHLTNEQRTQRTTTFLFYDGTKYSIVLDLSIFQRQATLEERILFFKNYRAQLDIALSEAVRADLVYPMMKGEGAKLVEDIRTLRDNTYTTVCELEAGGKPNQPNETAKTVYEGKTAKYPFYKANDDSYQYLRNFEDALVANQIDTKKDSSRFAELLLPKLNNNDKEKFRNLKDQEPSTVLSWKKVCDMFLEAVTVGDVAVINLDRYEGFKREWMESLTTMNRRFSDAVSFADISPTHRNTHLSYIKHLADQAYATANKLVNNRKACGMVLNLQELMNEAELVEKQNAPRMPEYLTKRMNNQKNQFIARNQLDGISNSRMRGNNRRFFNNNRNQKFKEGFNSNSSYNNRGNKPWNLSRGGGTGYDNAKRGAKSFGRGSFYKTPGRGGSFSRPNRFNNNGRNQSYFPVSNNNSQSNGQKPSFQKKFKPNGKSFNFQDKADRNSDNQLNINRITADNFFSYADSEPVIRRYTLPGSNVSVGEDIIIPLRVGGEKIQALVDSGARVSTVFKWWVMKNLGDVYIRPFEQDINLLDGSSIRVQELCQWPKIESDKVCFFADLLIVDMPGQEETKYGMIIGLDMMPRLGMTVTNLPINYASSSSSSNQSYQSDEIYQERYNMSALPELTDEEREDSERIKHEVQSVLDRNQLLRDDTICTIRESLVTLDTQGHQPIYTRQYRLNEKIEPVVRAQVQTWLENGVIAPAPVGTAWNSPLIAVPKKDEATGERSNHRICIDVRGVNNLLKDDKFPIPNIKHVLDNVVGNRFFSIIDLKDGYNHFPVHEDDQIKLAFTFDRKQYMFIRAPFGLKHLPSLFQRVISTIFKDMTCVISYIDDIVIFTNDMESMIWNLKTVVFRLTKAGMKIKLAKSHFGLPRIQLLGHTVSRDGVSPDRFKVNNLLKWPEPKSNKDMQSFLGLANYFSDYIPFYSTLTAPLNRMRTAKNHDWSKPFEGIYKEAFVKLKAMLSECITLHYPDFNARFHLATDASTFGLAGILLQYVDEKPRYISFMSRSLTKSERNYSATKLELTAILYCLKRCEYYLFGRRFTLITDHKALTYMMTQRYLNPMIARWYEIIMMFDMDIVHCAGTKWPIVLVDLGSRLYPTYAKLPEFDDGPITFMMATTRNAARAKSANNTPSHSNLSSNNNNSARRGLHNRRFGSNRNNQPNRNRFANRPARSIERILTDEGSFSTNVDWKLAPANL